ncbi:MAG: Uncharacterized protein G01um101493_271 [Microgenomates group bacterium Gr01-1014_93]|nr:MAG: Uncharacterized protein G01um101493_271 [Microgenomates group bacterium Gr01-1014_93]
MLKLMQKLFSLSKKILSLEKILFWGVLGLFIVIPLYPKFPLLNVPGTYVAIRLEDFFVTAIIGLFFIANLGRLQLLFKSTLFQVFLLFWGIGLLSLFSGIFLTQTVIPHLGILHFLRRVEYMLLFFVALNVFKNVAQIKLLLKIMLVVTLVIILYGFGQQWLSFPVISTSNREFSKGLILFLTHGARINSTFAGHYDLAIYMSGFLTVTVALLFSVKGIWYKLLISGVSFLGFIVLALTAARVSFASMVVGIIGLLWAIGQKKMIFLLLGLVLFAFVISPDLTHRTVATITVNLLGGGGEKYSPPPQVKNPTKNFSLENAATKSASLSSTPRDVVPGEPINPTELGVLRSFEIRINVEWPRAINAFFKNPLLGTGYSSLTIATDNDYLRTLGETGILGFLSFALIWFILVKRIGLSLRRSKGFKKYFFIGTLMMILVTFLNATFIDAFEASKIAGLLWLYLGTTYALTNIEDNV